jgi:hypothetical protein
VIITIVSFGGTNEAETAALQYRFARKGSRAENAYHQILTLLQRANMNSEKAPNEKE